MTERSDPTASKPRLLTLLYSPATSRSFSSKRGSLLSLKVRDRCGFRPRPPRPVHESSATPRLPRHRPARPMCRVLRQPRHRRLHHAAAHLLPLGVVAAAWLPPRARSFSIPAGPSSANRFRHRPTLFTSRPSSVAISLCEPLRSAFSGMHESAVLEGIEYWLRSACAL